MEELTSDDLLYLHHIVEERFRVFTGVKDLGLVQAIADRPKQKFYGTFIPYDDIFTKAASLLEGIIRMHPFYDGNKRTALLATIAYLELNGYMMIVPLSAVRFTVEIAKNQKNDPDSTAKLIKNIARWVKKLSVKNNSRLSFSLKLIRYFLLPLILVIPLTFITFGYLGRRVIEKWMAFDIYPEYRKEQKEIITFLVEVMGKGFAKEMRSSSG